MSVSIFLAVAGVCCTLAGLLIKDKYFIIIGHVWTVGGIVCIRIDALQGTLTSVGESVITLQRSNLSIMKMLMAVL